MAMLSLTVSTTWLGPTARLVSGGVQPVLLIPVKPADSVTVGTVRTSRRSTWRTVRLEHRFGLRTFRDIVSPSYWENGNNGSVPDREGGAADASGHANCLPISQQPRQCHS